MVQHSPELVDICNDTDAAVNAGTAVLCRFTSCKCFALLLPLLVADNEALRRARMVEIKPRTDTFPELEAQAMPKNTHTTAHILVTQGLVVRSGPDTPKGYLKFSILDPELNNKWEKMLPNQLENHKRRTRTYVNTNS